MVELTQHLCLAKRVAPLPCRCGRLQQDSNRRRTHEPYRQHHAVRPLRPGPRREPSAHCSRQQPPDTAHACCACTAWILCKYGCLACPHLQRFYTGSLAHLLIYNTSLTAPQMMLVGGPARSTGSRALHAGGVEQAPAAPGSLDARPSLPFMRRFMRQAWPQHPTRQPPRQAAMPVPGRRSPVAAVMPARHLKLVRPHRPAAAPRQTLSLRRAASRPAPPTTVWRCVPTTSESCCSAPRAAAPLQPPAPQRIRSRMRWRPPLPPPPLAPSLSPLPAKAPRCSAGSRCAPRRLSRVRLR
jgi:hypothetical protein